MTFLNDCEDIHSEDEAYQFIDQLVIEKNTAKLHELLYHNQRIIMELKLELESTAQALGSISKLKQYAAFNQSFQ